LNAVLYIAAGEGPHPNVLLLHGLPGNEQNIDLAQSMRRAGWNVLTFHYRGSWGGPVLLVTSDDGFAVGSNALGEAIQHRDGTCLSRAHFTTDHSYSDCRIELQIIVLRWLEALGECRREMGTVADI
jgi:pimeloyl-ACP methyl ester carboxylesterase